MQNYNYYKKNFNRTTYGWKVLGLNGKDLTTQFFKDSGIDRGTDLYSHGLDIDENIQILCSNCHKIKTKTDLRDFSYSLSEISDTAINNKSEIINHKSRCVAHDSYIVLWNSYGIHVVF